MVWILPSTTVVEGSSTDTCKRCCGVLVESTRLETVGDDARHQVAGAGHTPCPQARHPRFRQGQGAPRVLLALPEAPLSPRQALQVRRRPGETEIW